MSLAMVTIVMMAVEISAEIFWHILSEFRRNIVEESAAIILLGWMLWSFIAHPPEGVPGGAEVWEIDVIKVMIVRIGGILTGAWPFASAPIKRIAHAVQSRAQTHIGEHITVGIIKSKSMLLQGETKHNESNNSANSGKMRTDGAD